MGCDTIGKVKGFVKPDDLLNYIREKLGCQCRR